MAFFIYISGRHNISILMTRSIGDKFGPRSCICLPEISSYTVPEVRTRIYDILLHILSCNILHQIRFIQFKWQTRNMICLTLIISAVSLTLYFSHTVRTGHARTIYHCIWWILGCGLCRERTMYGPFESISRCETICIPLSSESIEKKRKKWNENWWY